MRLRDCSAFLLLLASDCPLDTAHFEPCLLDRHDRRLQAFNRPSGSRGCYLSQGLARVELTAQRGPAQPQRLWPYWSQPIETDGALLGNKVTVELSDLKYEAR